MSGLDFETVYTSAAGWSVWTPDDTGGIIGVGTTRANALENAKRNLLEAAEQIARELSAEKSRQEDEDH